MLLTETQLEQLAYLLLDTKNTVEAMLSTMKDVEEDYELTTKENNKLFDLIFQCESCELWILMFDRKDCMNDSIYLCVDCALEQDIN